ncbi:MAG: NAD(P)-dependent glycerol-3-phosphate dehydrogenase [Proteobacteria bacterium]|nr:NAD(P)-dependent glycerol-3-phosphate dehydrogenase [Pseudomonadota bacterium]
MNDRHARDTERIAVIGAGSWGTALARHLALQGLQVDLWVYEAEVAEQIAGRRENKTYLPGIPLPEGIRPSTDLSAVVREHDLVLLVVPSHVMRQVVSGMKDSLRPGVVLVSAAKGIENQTLMTMSQVIEEVLPDDLAFHRACLSGPTFAREVGRGLPTVMTVASPDRQASQRLQRLFSSTTMRVYASQDLMGVELGGALKNVFAIAAGISDGLELGTNARAALITRGLAEMSRLGVRMGANPLTFMGLAGLGDLVLTCTGDLSRNRTVGLKLGRGMKLADILAEMKMVAEGVKTTRSAFDLTRRENVDMPVTEQVYQVLYEDKDPRLGLIDLMTRDLKDEIDPSLGI